MNPNQNDASHQSQELPIGEDPNIMGGVAPTILPGNTPVTMTTIPSNSNTPAVTIDTTVSMLQQQQQNDNHSTMYADPGAIVPQQTPMGQQQQHQQNHQQQAHQNKPITSNNIIISADDIKKELEQGDYIGKTDYLNKGKKSANGSDVTSFFKLTVDIIESSQKNRTVLMEKQIMEQHHEYIRRFKGYPPSNNNNNNNNNSNNIDLQTNSTFQPEPCTGGKYLVTKLRNWRTGYERILSLHKSYFTTLDPDTNEITNLWKYKQVKQCSPVQNKEDDCILIDVFDDSNGNGGSSTKLKFQCRTNNRDNVLIAFVKCKYLNDLHLVSSSSNANGSMNYRLQKQIQDQNPLFECQRLTRHNNNNNARIQTLLVCAPHGLVEIDARTRSIPIQTYSYKSIRSICFVGDEGTGIVFYVGGINSIPINSSTLIQQQQQPTKIDPSKDGETICDEKVFFMTSSIRSGGSGRSDLVTVLKHKFGVLGLPLQFSESVLLQSLVQNKLQKGYFAGGCIGMFQVMQVSQRRECHIRGMQSDSVPNGNILEPFERYLVLTQYGYILECEKDKNSDSVDLIVVNCRKLRDIACIIRHSSQTSIHTDLPKANDVQTLFSIEYKDGLCRTYSSIKRDVIVTSILDSTVNLCRNYNATVTDVSTVGYLFTTLESPRLFGSMSKKSNESGIFQSDPVEIICLRRVQSIASTTNIYMDICLSPQSKKKVCDDDCIAITESCREFNINVSLGGVRNLPDEKNVISVTINNLWGIVSKLLTIRHSQSFGGGEETLIDGAGSLNDIDSTLSAIMQTLYRLMMTPHGYSNAKDDEVAMNVFSSMMSMITDLPLYWALKCASALILPRPFAVERDLDMESKNKTMLLRRIPDLVSVLTGNSQSCELVLMVVSNMLESVLCSHNDSTDADDISYMVQRLVEGYPQLMQLLYSESSILVENTALLINIIHKHSTSTASLVKEVALNSGLLLQHFYNAVFNDLDGQRFFSRFLCSLWFSGPSKCLEKQLLARIIPSGFFSYLSMPMLSDTEEEQLDEIQRGSQLGQKQRYKIEAPTFGAGTNVARLRERIKISNENEQSKGSSENFRIFFHVLEECHSIPDLIWNQTTRNELKHALEVELKSIQEETNRSGLSKIAWNHQQFKVTYPSLEREVKVGTIYLRLWLETGDSFIKSWTNPLRLFELLFRRFLCVLDRDHAITNMCIRCLERLYYMHSSKIGPFPDIMFLIRSMKETSNMETQQRLLHLIASLVGGISDKNNNDRGNFVQNAEQLLNIESFQTLCEFVALGHISTINTSPKNPRNESSSSNKSISFWFCVDEKSKPSRESVKGPYSVEELKQLHSKGLISKNCILRTSYPNNDLTTIGNTDENFFSQDWKQLKDIWHLRWSIVMCEESAGVFSPVELSSIALNCLSNIISAHQSVDSRGIAYVPVPVAKRLLCEPTPSNLKYSFISIICQMLLCGHSDIVRSTTSVVMKAMEYNDRACANLYLTGIFYFALTDVEDDVFEEVVTVVQHLHLKQNCSKLIQQESRTEVQSILDGILPHGVVNLLCNKNAKEFAQAFSESLDTPEVIWNPAMRNSLQSVIRMHLGRFPFVLQENMMEQYDFCPIPTIIYEGLQDDLYCKKYYLKNLCNEEKFPDWPILNPTEVFQECLRQWDETINSKYLEEEEAMLNKARQFLGLESSFTSDELVEVFSEWSKKFFHNETEMYQKGREAYELLNSSLAKKARSDVVSLREDFTPLGQEDVQGLGITLTQMQSTYLLLKTQLLICKRYSDEMFHLKYPVYDLLLSCLKFDPTDRGSTDPIHSSLLRVNRLEFTRTVVDLIFNTCLVSPSNAEELIKSNGVMHLEQQFNLYIGALTTFATTNADKESCTQFKLTTEIIIHILHTISGIAFFDFGREAIVSLQDCHRLCTNWRKCLDIIFVHGEPIGVNILKRYALEGIASMSKNEKLQEALVGCHIVWPLINAMLAYDPTIETPSMIQESFESSISKTEGNFHAFLATRALGMLCGVMKDNFATPPNRTLFSAMRNVLTQPLANMLSNGQSNELLMTLNLNIASPLRLWDEKMRSELATFVQNTEDSFRGKEYQTVEEALAASTTFEYSNLSNEVNIGGVYIRIFNNMDAKEAIGGLPDRTSFINALLSFIGRCIRNSIGTSFESDEDFHDKENSIDSENHWFPISDNRFVMSVSSVRQLVNVDGIIDDIMCTSTGILVLFELIALPQSNRAHDLGHEILLKMSAKKFFADAVGKHHIVLRKLISTLLFDDAISDKDGNVSKENDDPGSCENITWIQQKWAILEALAKSPIVASALVKSSVWLELIGVISCYKRFSSTPLGRLGAAKTLARLLWDPITTRTAGVLFQKILPASLVLIMKEKGAEVFLEAFDADSANPELFWDSAMREELELALAEQLGPVIDHQNQRAKLDDFCLDSMFSMRYGRLHDELYVGRVYVSLFLKDPTFNLRDPSGFFENLMIRWTQAIDTIVESKGKNANLEAENVLKQLTEATKILCKHSFLCVKLSPWGYMKHAIMYLHTFINLNVLTYPLESVIILLHNASSERVNIESIIDVRDTNGKNGIVDGIMKSIHGENLHPQTELMLETLKIIIKDALGDISEKNYSSFMNANPNSNQPTSYPDCERLQDFVPSPAPGKESVKNMKKLQGDDPLSMMLGDGTSFEANSIQTTSSFENGRKQISKRVQTSRQTNVQKQTAMHASKNQARYGPPQTQKMATSAAQPQKGTTNNLSQPIGSNQVARGAPQNLMSQSTPQYKHSVPPGRGVKPVRSQLNTNLRKRTDNTTHQLASNHTPNGTTYQTPRSNTNTISNRSHSQNVSNYSGGNIKPLYQPKSRTNIAPTPHIHNSQQNISNPQLLQNQYQFQHNNVIASSNTRQMVPPQTHYAPNNVNTNQFSQPIHGTPATQSTNYALPTQPMQHIAQPHQQQQHYQQHNMPVMNSLVQDQDPGSEPKTFEPKIDPNKIAEERIKSSEGAPGSAKGRNALLSCIISCGFIEFLVKEVLVESALESVKEPEKVKLQAGEIIKLLTMDPGYGLKFQLILKELNYQA